MNAPISANSTGGLLSNLIWCVEACVDVFRFGLEFITEWIDDQTAFARVCEMAGLNCLEERPRGGIVIVSLLFLLLFLFASIFAITFPYPVVKLVMTVITSTLSGVLLILLLRDISSSKCSINSISGLLMLPLGRERPYRRNLMNTVLTVLFTMVTMMAVYRSKWYDGLNSDSIELISRSVVRFALDNT